ncbi:DUF2269 domain-containing protein [Nocardia farcinica]|uniref:DUF2269 domain-containing protein n=1 Tax=Nocardia TaxID=1817 RepID=UPI0018961DF0|nr:MULTISPECIES: DUF2269 domain-containing protein [Nocardia]MBF6289739.1 DUF2269 domain-containing protein [Nocardia cyriacigeorgica]MBF6422231.1 DUF2269 domain-containing protein [Nocardia farcinica]MBF6433887.1 DUF2269 domain-containing protein [Nocardia farcinica]MBF6504955.1 DUF2269 domain-containing protein [Nocardia farcinica]
MNPRARKLALTAHVSTSAGWLGAVVAFLALAVIGATSPDIELVRAVDLLARPMAWWVLVPMSIASLLTGIVQSLGTPWGLIRHYWVLFKLVLNVVATGILVIYTPTVDPYAGVAHDPASTLDQLRAPTFVVHSIAALAILTGAMVLAMYRPRGLTPYGHWISSH